MTDGETLPEIAADAAPGAPPGTPPKKTGISDARVVAGFREPGPHGVTSVCSRQETCGLTTHERERYGWQITCPGVGEAGQEKLKAATVLVSRCGGVGGTVALELAAAGVGRLVIAHAGDIRVSDLNRQLLMTDGAVGTPRVASIRERLRAFNPLVEVVTVAENVNENNADRLVAGVDAAASCAPLFGERYALNAACVRRGIPLVSAAMYDFEFQVATLWAGRGPCFRCLHPEPPPWWQRRFPVFGAAAAVAGALAAVEIIKLLTGVGEPLLGALLAGDLRAMRLRRLAVARDRACPVCGPA